jgi:hypothetical protein
VGDDESTKERNQHYGTSDFLRVEVHGLSGDFAPYCMQTCAENLLNTTVTCLVDIYKGLFW